MRLDDYVFAVLGCVSIGVLLYIAMTLQSLFDLFKEWDERG